MYKYVNMVYTRIYLYRYICVNIHMTICKHVYICKYVQKYTCILLCNV